MLGEQQDMDELQNPFGFTLRPEVPGLTGLDRIWEDLAVAAECAAAQPSGRELARRINENAHVEQFTPAIAVTLYDSLEKLGVDPAREEAAANRLSDLLIHVNSVILTSALRTEVHPHRRATLLQNAVKALSIRAIMRLAQAASSAYNEPVARPLRALLRKTAKDAVSPCKTQEAAQRLFRDIVVQKFGEARVRSKIPITQGYQAMFEHAPTQRPPTRATPEPERVVQTAIEVDTVGEMVWVAVTEMIDAQRERELVGLLVDVPPDNQVARMILGRIAQQRLLNKLLEEDALDLPAVDLIIEQMGLAAAKVMLEVLAESRSRATRREVFQRLAHLGPAIGPLLEVRLKDRRWFVLRNMIALGREAGCALDWSMLAQFLGHKDARVRREVLLLLLRHDATYERALKQALQDSDRNVLRAALQAARSRLPQDAVPLLAQRITSSDFPPEFRVMAMHLLGRSSSHDALDALLHFAQGGKTLLGRPKLATKSPEMLAALSNLARAWPGERRVAALLATAQKARDEDVTSAAHIRITV
jgi:hypothetical protein